MGIASTHAVSRKKAIRMIREKVYHLSNEELSQVLETTLCNDYFNFFVCENEKGVKEMKEKGWPVIRKYDPTPDRNDLPYIDEDNV